MVFGGKFLTNLVGFREHNRRYEAGLNPWREDRKYYKDYEDHGGYNPYNDPYDLPRPQYWPNQGRGRGNGGERRDPRRDDLPEGPILPGPGYRKPRRGEKEDRNFLDPDDPEGSPYYKNNPGLLERERAAGFLPQRNGRGGARNRHGGPGHAGFPRDRGRDGRRSRGMDGGRDPFDGLPGGNGSRHRSMGGGSGRGHGGGNDSRYGPGGGRMKGAPSLASGVPY